MIAAIAINNIVVETVEVDRFVAMFVCRRLMMNYRTFELNEAGVQVDVFIEGVPSKMNEPSFLVQHEPYDHEYFNDHEL